MRQLLDPTDIRILKALQKDASASNVQLATAVGLSPSPCLARVKRLEEDGVIERYVALVEPGSFAPCISVFVQVSLEKQTEEALARFEKAVAGMPQVMECYLMSGDADYLLRLIVRDTSALRDFIVGTLSKVKDVSTIRSSFALKQVKYETALPIEALLDDQQPHKVARKK